MYTARKKPVYKRPLFIVASVLIFVAAAIAVLELTNTTHLLHTDSSKPAVTAGQSTKGETGNTKNNGSSGGSQSGSSSSQPGDTKSNTSSSTSLLEPTGTFVSAHKNVPVSANLSSVCNTTEGATCQITFTSGGTVKSLPIQTTDRGGATYWNSWTPASIGLTPGSWKIQAVASLNSQSKTSTDALNLEIAP